VRTGVLAMTPSVILAVAAVASPALSGKWRGPSPNGTEVLLDLSVSDALLQGSLTMGPDRVEIEDGRVTKNRFSFKATLHERSEAFSGELAGDEIKVWVDRQGPTAAVVLKRVK
jgi:hypothetical protein